LFTTVPKMIFIFLSFLDVYVFWRENNNFKITYLENIKIIIIKLKIIII